MPDELSGREKSRKGHRPKVSLRVTGWSGTEHNRKESIIMDTTPIDYAPYVVKSLTDPAGAIADLTSVLEDLLQAIAAATTAEKVKADGTKEVSPLEALYSKDEAGAKAAATYLRSKVFDAITDYCADNAQNTYHMMNAVKIVSGYLKGEVDYFNFKATPKAPKTGERTALKRKFNLGRDMVAYIAGIAANGGYDWKSDENLADKGGKPVSKLGGLRGIRSDDSQAAGRYAKVYHLEFTIDGEEIEEWNISDIVRYLWTGPERIGKSAKDLAEILDKSAKGWNRDDFKGATFKVNGHTVKVVRSDATLERA